MLQLGIQEKGLQLISQYDDNVPNYVFIDAQRVNQIILNLLQNALKFTNDGSITLTVSYDGRCNKLMFKVRDSGIGISEKDKDKLFTMFGKIEQTS